MNALPLIMALPFLLYSCVFPLPSSPGTNGERNLKGKVYVSCAENNTIAVIDPAVQEVFKVLPLETKILDMAVSPDNKLLAVLRAEKKDILLFDTAFDSQLAVIQLPVNEKPAKVIFSDNETLIVVTDRALYNLSPSERNLKKLYDKLPGHMEPIDHISISYQTSLLCFGGDVPGSSVIEFIEDNPATVFNYKSREVICEGTREVYFNIISPDGAFVWGLTYGFRHTFRFNIQEKKMEEVKTIQPFTDACFSNDGKVLYHSNYASPRLGIVDVNSMKEKLYDVDFPSKKLALFTAGELLYLTHPDEDLVSVFDLTVGEVAHRIKVQDAPTLVKTVVLR